MSASFSAVSLETTGGSLLDAKVGLSLVFKQVSGGVLLEAVFIGSAVPSVVNFLSGKKGFGSETRGTVRESDVALALSKRWSFGDGWLGSLQS